MLTAAILLTVLSILFAGTGAYAWREAFLTFRMVGEALDEAKKRPEPSVALPAPLPAPVLAPVRSGRTLVREPGVDSVEAPALFSKEQRREAIAKKANDPEFAERIEKTFRYRTTAHWLPQWKR